MDFTAINAVVAECDSIQQCRTALLTHLAKAFSKFARQYDDVSADFWLLQRWYEDAMETTIAYIEHEVGLRLTARAIWKYVR